MYKRQTWFTALALADRLAVAKRNVADSEQTLAVIRGRLQAGTASALDVANQATLVAGEQTNIPNFQNQLEPVSYTHLDVYKRQARGLASAR